MDLTPGSEVYRAAGDLMAQMFVDHSEGAGERWAADPRTRAIVDAVYRAGQEDAAKEVPAAQAAAVRGAGDGIKEALARVGGGSLTGDQIAQMFSSIAREIELGDPTSDRQRRAESWAQAEDEDY